MAGGAWEVWGCSCENQGDTAKVQKPRCMWRGRDGPDSARGVTWEAGGGGQAWLPVRILQLCEELL